LAIETVLTLRLLFQLPLRQAEGFVSLLLQLMGLNLYTPDQTTLSRRAKTTDSDFETLNTIGDSL